MLSEPPRQERTLFPISKQNNVLATLTELAVHQAQSIPATIGELEFPFPHEKGLQFALLHTLCHTLHSLLLAGFNHAVL